MRVDWWSGGRGFDSRRVQQDSFVEIDHGIVSAAASSFLWFEKDSCQFLAKERAQKILVNRLED